jgi:hypothetical protein
MKAGMLDREQLKTYLPMSLPAVLAVSRPCRSIRVWLNVTLGTASLCSDGFTTIYTTMTRCRIAGDEYATDASTTLLPA